MKVEYIAGRANVLADYLSRVPIQEVVGLYDLSAFDLTSEIPPTYLTLTARRSGMRTLTGDWRRASAPIVMMLQGQTWSCVTGAGTLGA